MSASDPSSLEPLQCKQELDAMEQGVQQVDGVAATCMDSEHSFFQSMRMARFLSPTVQDSEPIPTSNGWILLRWILVCGFLFFAFGALRRWIRYQRYRNRTPTKSSIRRSLRRFSSMFTPSRSKHARRSTVATNRPLLERSYSTSSILDNGVPTSYTRAGRDQGNQAQQQLDENDDEEEETEEESFARRWPAILETKYRYLVLPPECKRVEKPKGKVFQTENRKENSDRPGASSTVIRQDHDDDNPARRLVHYAQHLLQLCMAFLRLDFVGVGGTIFHWMEIICRRRRRKSPPTLDHVESEKDLSNAHTLDTAETTDTASVVGAGINESLTDTQEEELSTPRQSLHRTNSQQGYPDRGFLPTLVDNLEDDESSMLNGRSSPVKTSALHMSLPRSTLSARFGERGQDERESVGADIDMIMKTPPQTPMRKSNFEPDMSGLNLGNDVTSLSGNNDTIPIGESSEWPPTPLRNDSLTESRTMRSMQSYSMELPKLPTPSLKRERYDSVGNTYYFDTATTSECLKRMAVEVPVPDHNGFIVGDEFLPDPSTWTPLLVFVNSRSGSQQGQILIAQLRGLLNPIQVWDLAEGGPEEILSSFGNSLSRLRVLVCGGDGTVSWIVNSIEKLKFSKCPPIAILPLGTGNDLARIHGWGGGYNNESLIRILEQVAESYVSLLDQWEVTISPQKGGKKEIRSFFNYLGVGADAQAALQVHLLRESQPQLFFSRMVNKVWYGIFGAEDIVKASSENLPQEVTLVADGVEIPLPADSQGIIFLNIDSYAGGVPMWSMGDSNYSERMFKKNQWAHPPPGSALRRTKSFEIGESSVLGSTSGTAHSLPCDGPSSCQDGLLDVVSIRGIFHLGQIRVGLATPQRLCQCREAEIRIRTTVPVQMDGEPWRQKKCTLSIKRKPEATLMLHRAAERGVETEMANLLDWAQESDWIDSRTHAAMMKEFSRRIEERRYRERRESQRVMFPFIPDKKGM